MKADRKFKLIYQDHRKLRFVKNHLTGMGHVVLSKPGQELMVTAEQKRHLLKFRNGDKPCFVEAESETAKPTEIGGHDDGIR